MGMLRRLAQNLGLVYRDDGTWRPLGARKPPAPPPDRTGRAGNPSGETGETGGRPG